MGNEAAIVIDECGQQVLNLAVVLHRWEIEFCRQPPPAVISLPRRIVDRLGFPALP